MITSFLFVYMGTIHINNKCKHFILFFYILFNIISQDMKRWHVVHKRQACI